jgi:hypothetical protein
MRWITASLIVLAVFAISLDMARAEEEGAFITGYVTAYEEGSSITISNGENSMSFQITEDTEVIGSIHSGATVEVESNGEHAVYIEVTGVVEEDSESEEDESEE